MKFSSNAVLNSTHLAVKSSPKSWLLALDRNDVKSVKTRVHGNKVTVDLRQEHFSILKSRHLQCLNSSLLRFVWETGALRNTVKLNLRWNCETRHSEVPPPTVSELQSTEICLRLEFRGMQ